MLISENCIRPWSTYLSRKDVFLPWRFLNWFTNFRAVAAARRRVRVMLVQKRNCGTRGTHLFESPPSPLERRTMTSLKRDQNTSILPTDKGGATVVLDCDAYVQKAEQQLSDENTYNPRQCDSMVKQATSISKTISRLVLEEIISKQLAKQISLKETSIARVYDLRKLHKDGCPLRMIVSLIDPPCHSAAKWQQSILFVLYKFCHNPNMGCDRRLFVTPGLKWGP